MDGEIPYKIGGKPKKGKQNQKNAPKAMIKQPLHLSESQPYTALEPP